MFDRGESLRAIHTRKNELLILLYSNSYSNTKYGYLVESTWHVAAQPTWLRFDNDNTAASGTSQPGLHRTPDLK